MMKIRDISYNIPNDGNHIGLHEGKFRKKLKVKVGICDEKYVDEKEIEGLHKLNGDDNVQKLYYHTFHNSKCYFALEMFDVTLEEFMDKPKMELMKIDSIKIIKSITSGLKYLHDMQIVHGNINCKNIGICGIIRSVKICIGNANDQKGISFLSTQTPIDESLIKKDVCDLTKVIISVLSGTMDCDIQELVEILKKESELQPCIIEFFKWSNDVQNDFNHKTALKLSLIRQLYAKNSSLSCAAILKNPLFWSNKMKYQKLKEINTLWENEMPENIEYINSIGEILLKNCNWTNKLKKNCFNQKIKNNHVPKMSSLVKCVTSRIKYYQQAENHHSLQQEHMLYFLDNFPFLLTFMVIINDQLCIKKQKEKKCGFLHDKFVNNNLPLKFIIPPEAITIKNLIKKSNAEVYDGIYKKSAVALKRIPKMDFKLNELKSIINLKSTPVTGRKCKGCEQDECQNIIGFHGCFEIDEFVWIVMEKAKEDFKDFKFTNQEVKLQILFDTVKGLECLQANSISHLDIKPGNILVVERNKKLVGCLADFGESIDAIKKTYTRSKIRGTDGYIAPELEEAFKSDQKTRSKNQKRFILNYSKCDIYSLGMVIKKDYLNSIDKKESLDMNLMICEELVNYMTEKDPTSRPDVETVRKNPVFWDVTQKLKFLEHVHDYGDGHKKEVIKEGTTNPRALGRLVGNWSGLRSIEQ